MRAAGGAFVVALVVLFASGCGTGGPTSGGNASAGKKLFVADARCGSCHTLKDAGSRGTVGPNLDESFAQSKAEGFKTSAIENVVRDQIKYPTHGSGMPANLVTGQEADDVAAYVATCAASTDKTACPGIAATGKSGGEGLYASLGCQSCHSLDGSKSTGPTFKGLAGSKVQLTNGKTVTADDKYLIDSIIDPDLDIVQGYQPGVMSAVIHKGQIPKDQAQQLVDFITKQK